MARDISFPITQEAIENGIAKNSNHCMIAESIKAAYPHLKYVAVDIQTIRATDPDKAERYVWLTPRTVQQFIVDFDHGVRPKPMREVRLQRGQVVPSGHSATHNKKRKAKRAALKKTGHRVPIVRGGRTPPKSIGARREYGLRSIR